MSFLTHILAAAATTACATKHLIIHYSNTDLFSIPNVCLGGLGDVLESFDPICHKFTKYFLFVIKEVIWDDVTWRSKARDSWGRPGGWLRVGQTTEWEGARGSGGGHGQQLLGYRHFTFVRNRWLFTFFIYFHKRGFGLSVSEYLPSPLAMRNPNCSALKVKCQILGILRIEFQHHLTVEKVLVLKHFVAGLDLNWFRYTYKTLRKKHWSSQKT